MISARCGNWVPSSSNLGLHDAKVWRDTRYFADPFPAQEWRAQWVEAMSA